MRQQFQYLMAHPVDSKKQDTKMSVGIRIFECIEFQNIKKKHELETYILKIFVESKNNQIITTKQLISAQYITKK